MAGLIAAMGGPGPYVKRLDYLHESGLNYIGNEPAFLTVFQYHYAGRPGRSSYRAHLLVPQLAVSPETMTPVLWVVSWLSQ